MATHSNILAWKIQWTEELVGYSPWGHKESDTTEHTCMHTFLKKMKTCIVLRMIYESI